MPDAALELCPFCGRQPRQPEFVCESGSKDIWEVGCEECDFTLEGPRMPADEAKEAAIARWNTRSLARRNGVDEIAVDVRMSLEAFRNGEATFEETHADLLILTRRILNGEGQ